MSALLILTSTTARADAKTEAILKEVLAAYKAANTMTAELQFVQKQGGKVLMKETGTLKMMKPNLLLLQMGGKIGQTIASDGTTTWLYMQQQNQYMKQKVHPQGKGIFPLSLVEVFFQPTFESLTLMGGNMKPSSTRDLGNRTVEGKTFRVLELSGGEIPGTLHYFIGPDNLIYQMRVTMKSGNDTMVTEISLLNLKVGADLTASHFAFKLPEGATEFNPNTPTEASLLPVGKEAPNFTLPTPTGGQITLTNVLKEKKAVLVNFWFYG
jgi:outer membrane lipoprotein-sorting protein